MNLKTRVAQRATGQRTGGKELAVKSKVRTARQLFEQMKPQFAMALPRHIGVDRFLRTALTCVQRTPKLLDCTQESLLSALLEAARLGLEPGTKHAAIVPYRDKATFIAQWQGLVELMYRSGQVTSVTAEFIHEGDEWDYKVGDGGTFWHRPNLLASDRGAPVLCYAFAELKGGGRSKIVMLTRAQAEEIRDKYSRAYELAEQHRRDDADGFTRDPDRGWFNSTWHTDFEAMWRKSTVRRLADWVPSSPELRDLLGRENPAGEIDTDAAVDFNGVIDGEVISDSEENGPADESAAEPPADQPAQPAEPEEVDGWPPVAKPGSGGTDAG